MLEFSEVEQTLIEGSDFEKVLLLDNFYEEVDIANESPEDLQHLLDEAIRNTDNSYIKLTSFEFLCDLTLIDVIQKPFIALTHLESFLEGDVIMLKIAALRYIPRFDKKYLDVLEQLKILTDDEHADVASQAYFCLGLSMLLVITSGKEGEFLIQLHQAKQYFLASQASIENRVDATFFLSLIDFFEGIVIKDKQQTEVAFEKLERNLKYYSLYELEERDLELEYLAFRFAESLRQNLHTSITSEEWVDISGQIKTWAKIHIRLSTLLDVRTIYKETVSKIYRATIQKIEDQVYLTHLASSRRRLLALRERTVDQSILAFLNHIFNLLPEEKDSSSPERLGLLALLADQLGESAARSIYSRYLNQGRTIENALRQFLQQNKANRLPFRTGSVQGNEVLLALMQQIDVYLPHFPIEKRAVFVDVLEEVIRYARATLVKNEKKRFAFLYSKSEKVAGQPCLGEDVLEEDLQDSMFSYFAHSKIADGLDHEKAKFVDGGRVDIVYIKDVATIPIELKKTANRPDIKALEESYIAQAQTYVSGYDQLGIFVLLELSDKAKESPPNFKDWFNIHHLPPSTSLPVKYPDYVVSVIIPGNRTMPSSKSKYG